MISSQTLLLFAAVACFSMATIRVVDKLATFPLPFPAVGLHVQSLKPGLETIRPSPLEGRFTPQHHLEFGGRRLYGVTGCETVAVAPDGSLTLVDKHNNLYTATASPGTVVNGADKPHAFSGWKIEPHPRLQHLGTGRVLGAMYDKEGNFIFADQIKGLCMVNFTAPVPTVKILVSHLPSPPPGSSPIINFADDVDVHPNSTTIYFTDATIIRPLDTHADGTFDAMSASFLEAMRGQPSGRLLAYDPESGSASVLFSGIWFANGVAVSHDASFVAVCETFHLRVLRYWLAGPKAGTVDTLIDGLPGYPDGISRSSDGNFWVPLYLPYQKVQTLGTHSPVIRWMLSWVPKSLKPKYKGWGFVMKISPEGEVLKIMADLKGKVMTGITSVTEVDEMLYLGNLNQEYVGVFDLDLAHD